MWNRTFSVSLGALAAKQAAERVALRTSAAKALVYFRIFIAALEALRHPKLEFFRSP